MTRPKLSIPEITLSFAFAIIATWRIITLAPGGLWKDWLLTLTAYGIYTVFARTTRTWSITTTSVMAYLLAIYIHGQLPHALRILGLNH